MVTTGRPPTPNADTGRTLTIQRRYDRQAFRYDLTDAIPELFAARFRRRLWGLVPEGSHLLEVGVGTGKNMRWYPPGVSITAFDFSPRMLSRAARRATANDVPLTLALGDAQAQPFADASFDVALATFVFCSVPDPILGLTEVRRVLRPGGRLLLLEHVRSELPVLGRLMDWLNPLVVGLEGVNINRRTVENVRAAGFRLVDVQDYLFGILKLIVAEPVRAAA